MQHPVTTPHVGDLVRVVETFNHRRRGHLGVVTLIRRPGDPTMLRPGVMYVEYMFADGKTGWNWSENLKIVQSLNGKG